MFSARQKRGGANGTAPGPMRADRNDSFGSGGSPGLTPSPHGADARGLTELGSPSVYDDTVGYVPEPGDLLTAHVLSYTTTGTHGAPASPSHGCRLIILDDWGLPSDDSDNAVHTLGPAAFEEIQKRASQPGEPGEKFSPSQRREAMKNAPPSQTPRTAPRAVFQSVPPAVFHSVPPAVFQSVPPAVFQSHNTHFTQVPHAAPQAVGGNFASHDAHRSAVFHTMPRAEVQVRPRFHQPQFTQEPHTPPQAVAVRIANYGTHRGAGEPVFQPVHFHTQAPRAAPQAVAENFTSYHTHRSTDEATVLQPARFLEPHVMQVPHTAPQAENLSNYHTHRSAGEAVFESYNSNSAIRFTSSARSIPLLPDCYNNPAAEPRARYQLRFSAPTFVPGVGWGGHS